MFIPRWRAFRLVLVTTCVFGTFSSTGCDGFFLSDSDLSSVSISPRNVFLSEGAVMQLYATGTTIGGNSTDENANATWSSSNVTTATVGSNGSVTAISSEGTISSTAITVRARQKTDTTTVAVTTSPLVSLVVTPSSASITKGYTRQLLAIATLSDNNSVNVTSYVAWTSSDTSIATVSSTGKVTALATGNCTITAKVQMTSGAATSSMTITVN